MVERVVRGRQGDVPLHEACEQLHEASEQVHEACPRCTKPWRGCTKPWRGCTKACRLLTELVGACTKLEAHAQGFRGTTPGARARVRGWAPLAQHVQWARSGARQRFSGVLTFFATGAECVRSGVVRGHFGFERTKKEHRRCKSKS